MHSLDLPAGPSIRLTAAARPNVGVHRWDLRITSASGPTVAFGSQIGGLDRVQHVDIPAQSMACRVEISASHATVDGWLDDQWVVVEDTPNRLKIGFCNARSTTAQEDDVSVSLAFNGAKRSD